MKLRIACLLIVLGFTAGAQDLVVIHTNDLHSHLNGFSPEAEYTPLVKDGDLTKGGFSRIAGFINSEKEKYGNKILVVDAGDFLMGTLFQTIELKEGFQLNLMRKMGYDFVALGNHEFDFGPNALATIINNSKTKGDIPTLLCSNYIGSKVVDDDEFKKLFENEVVLPYSITEKNGLKIGLFAMLGVDADESISSDLGIKWAKQKKVAKSTAKYLKEKENVDLVIMLSHSGVSKSKKGNWEGEDFDIAKAVPDIDLIISGHTHTYLRNSIKSGNATIVQTGSKGVNVGRVEIKLNDDGSTQMKASLVKMNEDIVADSEIQRLIDDKTKVIENTILSHIGIGYNDIVAETSFNLSKDNKKPYESNLGPFVADAIYNQLNSDSAPGVDAVFVATGVIRSNIYAGKKGFQNINDVYNIMPLGIGEDEVPGRPLAKIYVNGNELKKVLELILAVAPSKLNYYLYFSGIEIDYNPEGRLFKKVLEIRIKSSNEFRTVDFSRKSNDLIGIAANNYMISFISNLKKMSFGLVKVIPKKEDGSPVINGDFIVDIDAEKEGVQEAKEWVAIYEFMRSFDDLNGNGIPDLPDVYKNKKNPIFTIDN